MVTIWDFSSKDDQIAFNLVNRLAFNVQFISPCKLQTMKKKKTDKTRLKSYHKSYVMKQEVFLQSELLLRMEKIHDHILE